MKVIRYENELGPLVDLGDGTPVFHEVVGTYAVVSDGQGGERRLAYTPRVAAFLRWRAVVDAAKEMTDRKTAITHLMMAGCTVSQAVSLLED